MKLEVFGFRQLRLMKLGLDVNDALLLRWFIDFSGTRTMKEVIGPDGLVYYWVSFSKVVKDIPLLTTSQRVASRKFQKLVDAGVLCRCSLAGGTGGGRTTCFRLSEDAVNTLLEDGEAMYQNSDIARGAMYQNGDIAMYQNGDIVSNINNNKIYNTCDNQLNDNYSSEPLKKAQSSSPVFIDLPLNDGSLFSVTEERIKKWSELYPAVDIRQQLRAMRGWCDSNPLRRKTSKGIARFINSWLAREQDRGGSRGSYSGANAQVSNPISNEAFAGAKGGEEAW